MTSVWHHFIFFSKNTSYLCLQHTHTHTCLCCVSDLLADAVWTGRSLPFVAGKSWIRDRGLRLAVCSASPLDILTWNVCVNGTPFLCSTSRNRKSKTLDLIRSRDTEKEREMDWERRGKKRQGSGKERDSWPLTRLKVPGLAWRSLASRPPRAAARPPRRCLPLSLCQRARLCERTGVGHHTYTTAEIWPRFQTQRLEAENFTRTSHLLFLYLLYVGGHTLTQHANTHTYRRFDKQRQC